MQKANELWHHRKELFPFLFALLLYFMLIWVTATKNAPPSKLCPQPLWSSTIQAPPEAPPLVQTQNQHLSYIEPWEVLFVAQHQINFLT